MTDEDHGWPALDDTQRRLVREWLPGAVVEADLSWGLVDTTVLRVRYDDALVVVKATGPGNGVVSREITAHRQWLRPWVRAGRGPVLLHADDDARVLVTRWVPGHLVEGTPGATDPDVHRQAGELLGHLHRQLSVDDDGFEAAADAKTLAWLASPHAVPADTARAVAAEVRGSSPGPVALVPTHGDYTPRNWVVERGVVGVIDLGRAGMRPAMSDLVRLAHREWRGRPDLEASFLEGYGSDPRDAAGWRRARLRQAVGTAVWAHQVGDHPFEQEGLQDLAELMSPESSGRLDVRRT